MAVSNKLPKYTPVVTSNLTVSAGWEAWFRLFANSAILTAGTGITITTTDAGSSISISTSYTGQASITTLGTIATGTWNATAIGISYGGTNATNATTAFNNLSPTTTKGDIITRDASNNIRLAVGTDDYVLAADSTKTSGLAYKNRPRILARLSSNTGNASTNETTVFTHTLSANTLASNGDAIRLTIWGTFAANANNKTIRIKFGATTITTVGAGAFNSGSFHYTTIVLRTSSTAQTASTTGYLNSSTTASRGDVASPSETLSGSVTVSVTLQGSSDNDAVLNAAILELLPN